MNLLTLRFANRELGRLFHCDHVANVRITFKEDIGTPGPSLGRARHVQGSGPWKNATSHVLAQRRAGYFDKYGHHSRHHAESLDAGGDARCHGGTRLFEL